MVDTPSQFISSAPLLWVPWTANSIQKLSHQMTTLDSPRLDYPSLLFFLASWQMIILVDLYSVAQAKTLGIFPFLSLTSYIKSMSKSVGSAFILNLESTSQYSHHYSPPFSPNTAATALTGLPASIPALLRAILHSYQNQLLKIHIRYCLFHSKPSMTSY